ncbi:MAG: hypothetical protein RMK29_12210 [Myxococcales bacterium]|nr:hypothetical protein [Myxococcota bacterium]MDW8282468.1 hypothetical protein [Myxococcales bacterium]
MIISNEFRQALGSLRGRQGWMFLDSVGVVTVGVGHRLHGVEEAVKLPFVRRGSREPAARLDIETAWNRLAQLRSAEQFGREFLPEFYRDVTDLWLPEEAIDALLQADVEEVVASLRSVLPEFDAYPLAAREALIEMALHHGSGFLLDERWAPLRHALEQQDHAAAASLCGSGEAGRRGEERTLWRSARFRRAARDRELDQSIQQKLSALMQSLSTLADTARVELKKIEMHIGDLAEDLVHKAKDLLDDLAAQAEAAAQAVKTHQTPPTGPPAEAPAAGASVAPAGSETPVEASSADDAGAPMS